MTQEMHKSTIYSSRPSDAYVRQYDGAPQAPITACHLIGGNPLSKPMLTWYYIDG